jgi:hypothetical protein
MQFDKHPKCIQIWVPYLTWCQLSQRPHSFIELVERRWRDNLQKPSCLGVKTQWFPAHFLLKCMKFELPGTDALGQVGKDAKRAGFHPWSRQQRPCPGAQRTGLACRLNFGGRKGAGRFLRGWQEWSGVITYFWIIIWVWFLLAKSWRQFRYKLCRWKLRRHAEK